MSGLLTRTLSARALKSLEETAFFLSCLLSGSIFLEPPTRALNALAIACDVLARALVLSTSVRREVRGLFARALSTKAIGPLEGKAHACFGAFLSETFLLPKHRQYLLRVRSSIWKRTPPKHRSHNKYSAHDATAIRVYSSGSCGPR